MATNKPKNIRIDKISIKNYKGIDSLELTFPKPVMDGEPDILVMGSENGVGKTSVIECCSLLLLALQKNEIKGDLDFRSNRVDIPNLVISAGAEECHIAGTVTVADKKIEIEITINKNEENEEDAIFKTSAEANIAIANDGIRYKDFEDIICGLDLNPVLSKKFLVFHSYRKVHEGNIDAEMMVEGDIPKPHSRHFMRSRRHSRHAIFKVEMLRSFMAQSKHYDADMGTKSKSQKITKKIDELLKTYARSGTGTFGMSSLGSEAMVHINVKDIKTEKLFNIDGLSSGQKEIISTIFLIWYSTLDNPCVVFIDEPELHLNPEWHRKLIKDITEMAPDNQYVIATHSKHIMGAVDEGNRTLLERSSEGG